MATIEEALYDVFGPGRADGGMSMREYDPAFGQEELVAVQAQLPQLTGRVPIATGPTGVYGRALFDAGRRQASQAAALGDLVSAARGRRMRARDEALIKKQREERAANEATRLQQGRLRGNIMAAVGELGESAMEFAGDEAKVAAKRKRDREAADKEREKERRAQSFRQSMAQRQGDVARSIAGMERATSLDASPRQAPMLDFSLSRNGAPAVTAGQKMLDRSAGAILGDIAQGYEGRRSADFVDNIVKKAGADAEKKFRRNIQYQRMLQGEDFVPVDDLDLEGVQ